MILKKKIGALALSLMLTIVFFSMSASEYATKPFPSPLSRMAEQRTPIENASKKLGLFESIKKDGFMLGLKKWWYGPEKVALDRLALLKKRDALNQDKLRIERALKTETNPGVIASLKAQLATIKDFLVENKEAVIAALGAAAAVGGGAAYYMRGQGTQPDQVPGSNQPGLPSSSLESPNAGQILVTQKEILDAGLQIAGGLHEQIGKQAGNLHERVEALLPRQVSGQEEDSQVPTQSPVSTRTEGPGEEDQSKKIDDLSGTVLLPRVEPLRDGSEEQGDGDVDVDEDEAVMAAAQSVLPKKETLVGDDSLTDSSQTGRFAQMKAFASTLVPTTNPPIMGMSPELKKAPVFGANQEAQDLELLARAQARVPVDPERKARLQAQKFQLRKQKQRKTGAQPDQLGQKSNLPEKIYAPGQSAPVDSTGREEALRAQKLRHRAKRLTGVLPTSQSKAAVEEEAAAAALVPK